MQFAAQMIRPAACLLALLLFSVAAAAREQLRVLAWDGYADAEVVAEFERRHDAEVVLTLVDSDDVLWARMQHGNGTDFDVFAVNTAELQRYVEKGLAVGIEPKSIPNRTRQLPRFRELAAIPGLVNKGTVFGIPYAYSEMGLIYNRRLVKQAPQSMAELWNPLYWGRVLAYDTSNHNFTLAGMLMPAADPFRLNDLEFRRASRKLVELRRNVLTFYSSPEEAVRLFNGNEVALVFGNYGTQQVKALKDAGADIGYVIPREGALAWLDCWAISRGSRNRPLAHAWINFMLERKVSQRLTEKHGLANTVTPFPSSAPDARIVWLQPVEDPARRKALWDRIMSGDTAEALAPTRGVPMQKGGR
jgi:putative spermidine/putrescine transport system substrate-binding protein